jgi:hypothetical protein
VIVTQANANPFANFLVLAKAETLIALKGGLYGSIPPDKYEAFVTNQEERNAANDLIARVELLSFAYERLFGLTERWKIATEGLHQGRIDWDSPEYVEWRLEADLFSSFAFYELSGLANVLDGLWSVAIPSGSELEYVIKARDRMLAHVSPKMMRQGNRGASIPLPGGGMTQAQVVSINSWDPVSRKYYLDELGLPESADFDEPLKRNRALILSASRLGEKDATHIKAFGMPEPNLDRAFRELAQVLENQVLPQIEGCFERAVADYGFLRLRRTPLGLYIEGLGTNSSAD